ncbi:MAG TPA: TIGR03013 family XrtA/PEP-CTERM system glycosyltransferase [Aliidongia sp.]|nr:TIGR03013 family XrtA/PEP-CTERM system glycosyltransferase [Aliidongia sp.]
MLLFRQNVRTTALVLFALDLLFFTGFDGAFFAALQSRSTINHIDGLVPVLVMIIVITLTLTYAIGLYRRDSVTAPLTAMGRLPIAIGLGAAAEALIVLLVFSPIYPDEIMFHSLSRCFGLVMVTAGVSFCAGVAARGMFDLLLQRHWFHRSILVVGTGRRASHLQQGMTTDTHRPTATLHFVPETILAGADRSAGALNGDGLDRDTVLEPAGRSLERVARDLGADEIVVAADDRRGLPIKSLLECKIAGFPVLNYAAFVERETGRIDLNWIELGWLAYSDGFRVRLIDTALKRALDIVVGVLGLVLTLPVLLVAVICIRLESPGPVFFRQERVTRGNKVFSLIKLRSMRQDAERNGPQWAAERDNRVTRVGSFLRRTRIDEIPQLINILAGDMSLVGPRPERPVFIEQLAAGIDLYLERHVVKAGLTGWAQVNYPYGASIEDAKAKLEYDLYYIKNFTILLDARILLQTLRIIFWPSGVR